MELNSKYKVDSMEIGRIFNMMQNDELIYDPYYQRNFVWDERHQAEFIRTILLGYPCPEIFIAEGAIDLETHKKYIHVIDGQQRLTTIKKFLSNELEVDKKCYKDLTVEDKTKVHNYEIGVVTLKLNPEQDIKEIEEIFRRLNIQMYSLTETEKQVSRLSDNEFMLIARVFTGDLTINDDKDEDEENDHGSDIGNKFKENPFIKSDFKSWVLSKNFDNIIKFFLNFDIYSEKDIKRNNTTKDCIDIIAIILTKKFYSRNLAEDELIHLTDQVSNNKNKIYNILNKSIEIFLHLHIPEVDTKKYAVRKKKYLLNRGNAFSLLVALCFEYDNINDINMEKLQHNMDLFCENMPEDFLEAARNSVMDKKQREIRHKYLTQIIQNSYN